MASGKSTNNLRSPLRVHAFCFIRNFTHPEMLISYQLHKISHGEGNEIVRMPLYFQLMSKMNEPLGVALITRLSAGDWTEV